MPADHHSPRRARHRGWFPRGVVNVVLGGADVVRQLAAHDDVAGVSFVGSSEIARVVYVMATSAGKRCQAQGGSNNHLYISASAALDRCMPNIVSSLYGNASQRCFAGSNVLIHRSVYRQAVDQLVEQSRRLRLGDGTHADTTLGPVISERARQRFVEAVDAAEAAGATVLLDGRGATVDGYPGGHWFGPTIVEAAPMLRCGSTSVRRALRRPVDSMDEALSIINRSSFGHTR